ncbi:hypothetical protein [Parvularcula dongshanensis]|uniref:Uncharacterized protein n=1 Tax=Parvularcula dongshanensis TaxID=1173995 RepID=A0A840I5L4_9PROT|nr:hypothetical protein [Parvularcula dongshanensis]MBB4660149.1 hypothetical protein [Parvularcula dongshanensis]
MTSATEAVRSVDALASQLQAALQDGRFTAFRERLFGLRTVLGDARERFMAEHAGDLREKPAYARIQDRALQGTQLGDGLTPDESSLSQYGRAVERVIAALTAPGAPPNDLRGALRLGTTIPLGRSVAGGPPTQRRGAEPYYTSLVKLFPVEAVTLYPLAVSIAEGSAAVRLVLLAIICAFVVALRYFGTQEEMQGRADFPAIGVAIVSFLLYAASLGGFGQLPGGEEQTTEVFAFITVMWVALVPFVLRRRPPT